MQTLVLNPGGDASTFFKNENQRRDGFSYVVLQTIRNYTD